MFVYVFCVFSVSLYSSFNEHLTLSKTILHKVAIQSTNLHMQHFTKQIVNKKKNPSCSEKQHHAEISEISQLQSKRVA